MNELSKDRLKIIAEIELLQALKEGERSAEQKGWLPAENIKHNLKIMRLLSVEAGQAGAADMTLDEINSEIDDARKGL